MSRQTLLLATLMVAGLSQNGPRVSARITSPSAGVGETVTFDVVVQDAGDDVQIGAPKIPAGFQLVGTQDYSEMHVSIPGGRHVTRRREFALLAQTPGKWRIPPVAVVIGNRTYNTNPVDVTVTGLPQPRSTESTDEAWLHATMKPETVFVGQQSTLTVEAGFSEDVRVRLTRPPVFDTPAPTGFWVQDVPGGPTSRLASVNGSIVEIQSLQRAYFPLSAGKFAFAPARVMIDVREGFLFAPETHEIRSTSPKLLVLPLPDKGKPADFKGAVGSYNIRAFVEPDTVAAGEAAQVTVEISGTGNIKGAPPPNLPTIAGVEQFAPTEEATVAFDGATVRGTKRFQWVVIASHSGKIEIPAIAYSFFDPAARAYRTVRTDPLSLVVTPAVASSGDNVLGTTLEAIRTKPQHASGEWVHAGWFFWLQALPLLLLLGAIAAKRMRGRRSEESVLIGELQRIKTADTAFATFLRDVEAVVRNAAALRTGDASLRTAEVRTLHQRLRASGVDETIAGRVVAVIERIETQRFAPAAAETAERASILTEVDALVRELTSGRARERANGRTYASAIFILAAVAQMNGTAPFERGIQLYHNGRFADAAAAFQQVVQQDSTNISAWANLGNAYFRAGDRGHAVWAWARAVQMAPRDGALVRNLQAAGAMEVLRTRPPLSVRPQEWYLLAALAWWITCALAAAVMLRGRRTLLPWAVASVILGFVALTTGIVASRASYAVALDPETPLYGDPTVHSPIVRRVQAGAGLDVLDVRGDWLQVRTLTQAEGWVEADDVGRL